MGGAGLDRASLRRRRRGSAATQRDPDPHRKGPPVGPGEIRNPLRGSGLPGRLGRLVPPRIERGRRPGNLDLPAEQDRIRQPARSSLHRLGWFGHRDQVLGIRCVWPLETVDERPAADGAGIAVVVHALVADEHFDRHRKLEDHGVALDPGAIELGVRARLGRDGRALAVDRDGRLTGPGGDAERQSVSACRGMERDAPVPGIVRVHGERDGAAIGQRGAEARGRVEVNQQPPLVDAEQGPAERGEDPLQVGRTAGTVEPGLSFDPAAGFERVLVEEPRSVEGDAGEDGVVERSLHGVGVAGIRLELEQPEIPHEAADRRRRFRCTLARWVVRTPRPAIPSRAALLAPR